MLVLLLAPASAQAAASRRVGHRPAIPAGAKPVGGLAQSTRLTVTVTLAPRDPVALAAYASAVATPGTPVYGRYLSVAGFAQRFGPTATQISAVRASLQAQGLDPGPLAADHLSVSITAPASRLSSAFDTSFERYRLRGGRTAYANTSAPLLTGSGASVIQGVIGLSNMSVVKPVGLARGRSHWSASSAATPLVTPSATSACSAARNTAYTASQIATAYGMNTLTSAGDLGSGVTVGLFELEPYASSDISTYKSCYGAGTSVSNVAVDGGSKCNSDPNCGIEDVLDIEDVVGLAPKAKVLVYEGPNDSSGTGTYDTYQKMITDDRAKVISTSWGLCEAGTGPSFAAAENTLFQEAAVQGQSVLAASGDSGVDDCSAVGLTETTPTVDDPASQPYVTGVGGTSLTTLGPPPAESVWNDGPPNGAGGGGVSTLWSAPSWQTGFAVSQTAISCGSGGHACREVPDVSANADPNTGYAIYWGAGGGWMPVAGTSAAAPTWASLLTLAEASSSCGGSPVGFLNPLLYKAASSDYAANFNDITSGDNGYDAIAGYSAQSGYDMASGLGSPRAASLTAAICAGHDSVTITGAPGSQRVHQGQAIALLRVTAKSAQGKTPIKYSASGLPSGLAIGSTSGVISGTPRASGTYTVTLAATDAFGAVARAKFQIVVIGLPRVSAHQLHVSGTSGTLSLTLLAGQYAPALRRVELIAPSGAHLSRTGSVRALSAKGTAESIAARVSSGHLYVSFRTATASSQLQLAKSKLTFSKALASGLARNTKSIKLTVVLTDTAGSVTRVTVTLR